MNMVTYFCFVYSHIYEENGIPQCCLAPEISHPAGNCTGGKLPAQYESSSTSSRLEDSEYLIG